MKAGDKVLVRKPDNAAEYPGWVTSMDSYDGTIQEVEWVERYVALKTIKRMFNLKWLTPVVECKGKYYRVADESDIGSPIWVSDLEPEKILGDGRPLLTLSRIDRGNSHPFVAGCENWAYGMVEVNPESDEVEINSGEVKLTRLDTPPKARSKSLQTHLNGGVNCRTYEEKYALLEYLSQLGYKWYSGDEIHGFDWSRYHESGLVRASLSGVRHGYFDMDLPYFSTLEEYPYIMEKYAPAKTSEPRLEFKDGSSRVDCSTTCIPKLECSVDSYPRSAEKTSEAVNNPAVDAAKPQKESKMALLSLASKKVRGLVYGVLDWAFISPLKRTFKPVATITQFSICYLTIAAAGYFAYGLYQNPQSVVEWISEISPVEIRLKNTEE